MPFSAFNKSPLTQSFLPETLLLQLTHLLFGKKCREMSGVTLLDEHILQDLFNRYFDNIYANFLSKTKRHDIASDLTQATFVKFWNYRSSYSPEISVEAQLYQKAKQVFIDWLRREAHQRKLIKEIENDTERNESSRLELTDLLKKAIEQLPPIRKKIFLLSYVEGFSNKEIASLQKISIRTVEGHVQKALYQLRKSLTWHLVLLAAFIV
ncbi:RNA polymerase sigma factor [Pinibacter soli]|uniref:RNA polymerase sigma factor n=1 Tax=Pinibacter soli TaxID=3044211 RepID=A0ABT6RJ71_9BACT|nr:RNA polymerase sigma factor [Pinibacter soli]MDI3321914.1 RNA polymerase sigma factor [Pinibacter soli]